MQDKKIYKFPEIEEIIAEQKYKYCRLTDLAGEVLVPYNSIKKPLKGKLEEIKTRIKRLPPGVYCIMCNVTYGTHAKADKYYLGIGKYDPTALNDAPVLIEKKETLRERNTSPDKLLSIEQALDNMRELAELKAENARLKAENENLKAEILQLEEDYEDGEEDSLGETTNGLASMFKDLLPVVEPLADRYFKLEEQKLNFQQAKFLSQNGYELPNFKKKNGATQQVNGAPKKEKQLPEAGTPEFENFIAELCNLSDSDFENAMKQLEENTPQEYYSAICERVYDESEEGSEQ
jgi:hypothetical protein